MGQRRKRVVVFWAMALAGVSLAGRSGHEPTTDSDAPPVPAPRRAETAPDGWVASAPRDEIRT